MVGDTLTPFWDTLPPLLKSGGYHWRPVQTGSLEALPSVLTTSGGHRKSTCPYSFQRVCGQVEEY